MYTFKTMIYNLLEDYKNKHKDLLSVITYYKAFFIALALRDILDKKDSYSTAEKRNAMIKAYLNNPTNEKKSKMLNQVSKDRKIIEDVLNRIKVYEGDFIYTEENVDLKFIDGCLGTIVEG